MNIWTRARGRQMWHFFWELVQLRVEASYKTFPNSASPLIQLISICKGKRKWAAPTGVLCSIVARVNKITEEKKEFVESKLKNFVISSKGEKTFEIFVSPFPFSAANNDFIFLFCGVMLHKYGARAKAKFPSQSRDTYTQTRLLVIPRLAAGVSQPADTIFARAKKK